MKIANFILAILFVVFAVVQINDPDPWLWVLLYGYVALISLGAAFAKYHKLAIGAGIFICLIGMAFLFPKLIDWIQQGMPTIAGSMKAETPYIEFTREFFGLFICLIVLVFHYAQMKKTNLKKL